MPKWLSVVLIGSGLIFIFFLVLIFINDTFGDNHITDIEQSSNQIVEQFEQVNKNSKEQFKDIDEEEPFAEEHADQYASLNNIDRRILLANDEPHEAGEFLIGSLQLNDLDLFSQAFHPNQYNDTLMSFKVEELTNELQKIINQLSKNQSIKGFNIETNTKMYGAESDEIDITIYYDDGTHIVIENVPTVPLSNEHSNSSNAIYVIDLPPHKLLEKIK